MIKNTNAARVMRYSRRRLKKQRRQYIIRRVIRQAIISLAVGGAVAAVLVPLGILERGYFAFGGDGVAAVMTALITLGRRLQQ